MLFVTHYFTRRLAREALWKHIPFCIQLRKLQDYTLQRKWRGNLKTMSLQSPILDNLMTPEMKKLCDLFEKYNYEIRIAGGAVRDVLMNKTPHDIDFATTATPSQMKEMFTEEGIRMINMNGEKHGTITARIDDKENFEVTTLRIDVVTDGRRAEVAFTTDWKIDANRRDLTINAMFLDFQWTLYDYFNGKEDLENKRIRFVGDPNERIQEDYLRIMRYFRFFGRIADSNTVHEKEAIDAIKQNANGLQMISGERLWMELSKITVGNFAFNLMETMVLCDVHTYLGFPDNCNLEEFKRVCEVTEGKQYHVMSRLVALLSTDDQVKVLRRSFEILDTVKLRYLELDGTVSKLRDIRVFEISRLYDLDKRLKFSNDEFDIGIFIIHNRDTPMGDDKLKFCKYLLIDTTGKEKKTFENICELLRYRNEPDLLEEFRKWPLPTLPVTGSDLVTMNIPRGPLFKQTFDEVRQRWKFSDFTLTKEELLDMVPQIFEDLKINPRKQSPKPKRKRRS